MNKVLSVVTSRPLKTTDVSSIELYFGPINDYNGPNL